MAFRDRRRRRRERAEIAGELIESGAELAATGLVGLLLRGGGAIFKGLGKVLDFFN